jgi:hypothetical protein
VILCGERVVVELAWRNDAAEPLTFELARGPTTGVVQFASDDPTRDFEVWRGGERIRYSGVAACGGGQKVVRLKPGGVDRHLYDVTDNYDFSEPGTYEIRCAYRSEPRAKYRGRVWTGMLIPKPVFLKVIARP